MSHYEKRIASNLHEGLSDDEIIIIGGELLRAAFTSPASQTKEGDDLLSKAFELRMTRAHNVDSD
jgi:hypothetical protein